MHAITGRSAAIRTAADQLEAQGVGCFTRSRGRVRGTDDTLVRAAVERARAGDDDALRFLYLQYAGTVYSFVRSMIPDDYEAEDVTQTVFASLPRRLQRYRPSLVPFSAWITTVARNATIDHLRAKRMVPCERALDPETPHEDLSHERLAAIRTALEQLPPAQREVLVLRFVVGMGVKEVAERLGRTELAIDSLQSRARARLRAELVELDAAPTTRH